MIDQAGSQFLGMVDHRPVLVHPRSLAMLLARSPSLRTGADPPCGTVERPPTVGWLGTVWNDALLPMLPDLSWVSVMGQMPYYWWNLKRKGILPLYNCYWWLILVNQGSVLTSTGETQQPTAGTLRESTQWCLAISVITLSGCPMLSIGIVSSYLWMGFLRPVSWECERQGPEFINKLRVFTSPSFSLVHCGLE